MECALCKARILFGVQRVGADVLWISVGLAGANAGGALGSRVLSRILSRRDAHREWVGWQAPEDLGHRDRGCGEKICWRVFRVER